MTTRAQRDAWLAGVSLLVLLGAAIVIMRAVPLDRTIEPLLADIHDLGLAGLIIFVLLYALATVALVPASLLTLAAGAIFGVVTGVVLTSVASVLGAATAFLVARHAARARVTALAERHPRWRAVDRAVADGGWKIVALTRLSPVFPFTLQNYLYGLTAIPFRTYVLASWIAMLPGTVTYVYLGHAGRAASGVGKERTPVEWTLLGIGLAATIAVTALLTHLARRRLAMAVPAVEAAASRVDAAPSRWRVLLPLCATIAAVIAIVVTVWAGSGSRDIVP